MDFITPFDENLAVSHFSLDNIDAEFYFGSMFQGDFKAFPHSTQAHEHAWYEFHCVKKGCLKITVNEKIYFIKANEALFIPPRVYHNSRTESDDTVYASFGFELSFSGKNTHENLYNEMTNIFSQTPCVKLIKCRALADLSQELVLHIKSGKSADSCRMHNSLTTFLFLLSDRLCTDTKITAEKSNTVFEEKTDKRNYLLDHLTSNQIDNITLEELSQKIYLDKKQINRIVKKRYNMTYKQKQIRFRIENAKKQLSESALPIDTIAQQIGYTNLTSFYKAFRKIVGMTPAEYRKSIK